MMNLLAAIVVALYPTIGTNGPLPDFEPVQVRADSPNLVWVDRISVDANNVLTIKFDGAICTGPLGGTLSCSDGQTATADLLIDPPVGGVTRWRLTYGRIEKQ